MKNVSEIMFGRCLHCNLGLTVYRTLKMIIILFLSNIRFGRVKETSQ